MQIEVNNQVVVALNFALSYFAEINAFPEELQDRLEELGMAFDELPDAVKDSSINIKTTAEFCIDTMLQYAQELKDKYNAV